MTLGTFDQAGCPQRLDVRLHSAQVPAEVTGQRRDGNLRLGVQVAEQPLPLTGHDPGEGFP
jgi:hypothetical protein